MIALKLRIFSFGVGFVLCAAEPSSGIAAGSHDTADNTCQAGADHLFCAVVMLLP